MIPTTLKTLCLPPYEYSNDLIVDTDHDNAPIKLWGGL